METATAGVQAGLTSLQRRALTFVMLMGGVSLLADMVYEGARSISGPYLALLGASGTVVGLGAQESILRTAVATMVSPERCDDAVFLSVVLCAHPG